MEQCGHHLNYTCHLSTTCYNSSELLGSQRLLHKVQADGGKCLEGQVTRVVVNQENPLESVEPALPLNPVHVGPAVRHQRSV